MSGIKGIDEETVRGALGLKENATEETLQSIDSTLKRIEAILLHKYEYKIQLGNK